MEVVHLADGRGHLFTVSASKPKAFDLIDLVGRKCRVFCPDDDVWIGFAPRGTSGKPDTPGQFVDRSTEALELSEGVPDLLPKGAEGKVLVPGRLRRWVVLEPDSIDDARVIIKPLSREGGVLG